MAITTDDVEHLPHVVIIRTDGKVKDVQEFTCGTDAHAFATRAALDKLGGEIIVCARIRCLETYSHRTRHKNN